MPGINALLARSATVSVAQLRAPRRARGGGPAGEGRRAAPRRRLRAADAGRPAGARARRAVPLAGRVTLQTLADALGVSRTTVSNAYNRPDQLAPELRAAILEKAAELGYAGPDPAARRLRSGKRRAVALMFSARLSYAVTDPAAIALLQGLTEATEAKGYELLLLPGQRGTGSRSSPCARRSSARSASTACPTTTPR